MQNELFVKEFVNTGSITTLLNWIRYLKSKEYYHLVIYIGELMYPLFSYNVEFMDELGMCYYYCSDYLKSWDIYMDILESSILTEEQQKAYFFNAHFNIPHIINSIEYPDPRLISQIKFNKQAIPLITFSITTCKRYDLFERTMNSFLNHCEDIDLIVHWICVDDNSTKEDRIKMKKNYPFFDFVWKTAEQKGHAQSMNIIMQKVSTPYVFHIEDDWQFFSNTPYITQCLEVLNENETFGQCLVNKNYAETFEDICILGGQFQKTNNGLRYYIHEHEPNGEAFAQKYGNGVNCAYWAHYSLRPGLNRISVWKDVGEFNPEATHFEMDFAYRYMNKGYRTTFLDAISCTHIGRLTSEKNRDNAYTLNNESQFGRELQNDDASVQVVEEDEYQCIIINLENRQDRMKAMETEIKKRKEEDGEFFNVRRFSAVDGNKLQPTRQLEQVFNPNDYNYRRGMIGCALSHITLWIELISKTGVFIILEDDVKFAPYFTMKLKHVFDQLEGTNWDIIFLGHHLYDRYKTLDSYHPDKLTTVEKWSVDRSLTESVGGTTGYVVNRNGALKMLAFIQRHGMTNGIDTMMQKMCDDLDVYYCKPHLIYSEYYNIHNMTSLDTDIQRNYDSLKRDIQTRLQDEVDFYKSENVSVAICNEEKHNHAMEDKVCLCFNGCENKNNGIYYFIENVRVHVPKALVVNNPKLTDVGFLKDKRLSVENLIKVV